MLYCKPVLAILLGLIFLSFFGTLGMSAVMFPQSYDWRYRVISNLLSPRDNPGHYWLAACGVALTAVFMVPFAGYLQRHLEVASPRVARVSYRAFVAGIVALICTCLVCLSTPTACSEFGGCTNFLPAHPQHLLQLECCVAAGVRGRAAAKLRFRRDCFGRGRF
jgi:MFS family permease